MTLQRIKHQRNLRKHRHNDRRFMRTENASKIQPSWGKQNTNINREVVSINRTPLNNGSMTAQKITNTRAQVLAESTLFGLKYWGCTTLNRVVA